ncbi:MAG TPA: hypothetical protein VEV20_07600 [Burkholderiales bacterium]|nr:hypothetical protein [Burkholderiales bacterium]
MLNTRRLILAAGLVVAATLAAAAPVKQAPADSSAADPQCPGVTASMIQMIGGALPAQPFVQEAEEDNITGGPDSIIEEYLSFHAQATQGNGKFSLMPWTGLNRPYAN